MRVCALVAVLAASCDGEVAPSQAVAVAPSTTTLWRGEPGSGALRALWGSGHRTLWAVGDRGLIVHFDGRLWRRQACPAAVDLVAIHGCADDEIWAVGDDTVLHYDGSSWRVATVRGLYPLELKSVFCTRPGEVWAAERRFVIRRDPITERWQRMGRRAIDEPHAPTAVWGPRGGGLWVGDGDGVFRFTGGLTWAREAHFPAPLSALAGTAHQRWAATPRGLYRYEIATPGRRAGWRPRRLPRRRSVTISSLALTSKGALYALGAAGLLLRSAAGDWQVDARLAPRHGPLHLERLARPGEDDVVFAVGGLWRPESQLRAVVVRVDSVAEAEH